MITCHVFFDKFHFYGNKKSQVGTVNGNDDENEMNTTQKERMNRIAIILFPVLLIPFNVVYFILHFV